MVQLLLAMGAVGDDEYLILFYSAAHKLFQIGANQIQRAASVVRATHAVGVKQDRHIV
jgi:hypothetical protein